MAGIDIALDVFTFCVVSSAVRLYYVWQLHLVVAGSLPRSKFTAISTWNDVWAHIEAYASIVTACLPMLVPLFSGIRSPESLLGSFKAFFSLKSSSDAHSSKHSHALREVGNVPSPSSTVRNWYELPGTKSTASRAVRLPDEESLVAHPSSIQVKTSIRSQYEPRDK
ncbi:MAG: hypothetical protein LQ350_005294 [Teloschistes chrysophthalmus]|nr:MAG: hypothetical protein LQ350_005294 [Niorma chrysophthalma]